MNDFCSKKEIVEAVLKGIHCARTQYAFWTANKIQLLDACEDYLCIYTAQEIAKIQNPPEIFMHATVSDILKCSLHQRDQYKQFMQKYSLAQDTISITLDERFTHENDQDSISRVVIRVKNGVVNNKKEHTQDIEQLCKILQRENKEDSTLDFALFAFYLEISSSARIDAQQRIKNIVSSFDEVVQNYTNLKSNFEGGDIHTIENTGQWSIGCYSIEPNTDK